MYAKYEKKKIENSSPFSFFSESMEIPIKLVDLESISTCTDFLSLMPKKGTL
jgi:hypothetical protein